MRRPRADDDDLTVTYLGIGTLHGVAEPDEEPEGGPPGIWLPMHRSGSRMGGWKRKPVASQTRPLGFGKPR